ncbi:Hypothetical predicted protein [Octopus vulgaris]|uniref:Uncharacterized protein n=1 Tax=Octopus vulgaris TaxID=6645 RepID=A0AA36FGC3_OCTVU|nr:Hypothetical predicted protein [Octopus vulgaris]
MTLPSTLLAIGRNVIRFQSSHSERSPFFGNLTISPFFHLRVAAVHRSRLPPFSTNYTFKPYTRQEIPIIRACTVNLQHGDVKRVPTVYVATGNRPDLLGRDLLRQIPGSLIVIETLCDTPSVEQL